MTAGKLLRGVPAGEYHGDKFDGPPRLSQSMAALLLNECPAVAYDAHSRLGGHAPAPTREMEMGSLLHGLVLEDRVPPEYEVVSLPNPKVLEAPSVDLMAALKASLAGGLLEAPKGTAETLPLYPTDYRTKAAQEARDAIRAAGKVPILARELQEAQETAKKVRRAVDAATGGAISHGETELVALWDEFVGEGEGEEDEEEEGVACKARLDLVSWVSRPPVDLGDAMGRVDNGAGQLVEGCVIYDLKFVRSAHPQRWGRGMVAAGYDVQQAAYRSALETIYPELQGRVHFQFVLIQLEPLLLVTLPTLAGSTIDHGEKRWKRALKMWKRCLNTNDWPGFDDSEPIELPPHLLMQEMYSQLAEEEA